MHGLLVMPLFEVLRAARFCQIGAVFGVSLEGDLAAAARAADVEAEDLQSQVGLSLNDLCVWRGGGVSTEAEAEAEAQAEAVAEAEAQAQAEAEAEAEAETEQRNPK